MQQPVRNIDFETRVKVALITLVIGALCLCSQAILAEQDAQDNADYQEGTKCGPNSLFVFLILSGRPDVSLEQINELLRGSDSTSLLPLRNVAIKLGVNAEVRRYSPEDLASLPLPAIIQYKQGDSILPYHFKVVYKVDAERFYFIDGTTAAMSSGRNSVLPNKWTGYALIKKEPFGRLGRTSTILTLGAFVLGFEILAFTCFPKRKAVKAGQETAEKRGTACAI